MTDCLFCKIEKGEIPCKKVYEDADVIVLIVPRKHIASLNELLPEDQQLMGKMMLLLPKLAKEQGLSQGFRTIINTGKGGGQEVFHIHIHLLGGGHLPFV